MIAICKVLAPLAIPTVLARWLAGWPAGCKAGMLGAARVPAPASLALLVIGALLESTLAGRQAVLAILAIISIPWLLAVSDSFRYSTHMGRVS